jgi:hypothetical protein
MLPSSKFILPAAAALPLLLAQQDSGLDPDTITMIVVAAVIVLVGLGAYAYYSSQARSETGRKKRKEPIAVTGDEHAAVAEKEADVQDYASTDQVRQVLDQLDEPHSWSDFHRMLKEKRGDLPIQKALLDDWIMAADHLKTRSARFPDSPSDVAEQINQELNQRKA